MHRFYASVKDTPAAAAATGATKHKVVSPLVFDEIVVPILYPDDSVQSLWKIDQKDVSEMLLSVASTTSKRVVRDVAESYQGKSLTYGEVKAASVAAHLWPSMRLRNGDTFYDLGSGTGKIPLQMALMCVDAGLNVHCRGLELAYDRTVQASDAMTRLAATTAATLQDRIVHTLQAHAASGKLQRLADDALFAPIVAAMQKGAASGVAAAATASLVTPAVAPAVQTAAATLLSVMKTAGSRLTLERGDILVADLSDATAVFVNNFVFENTLMQPLRCRLAALPRLRVLTLLQPLCARHRERCRVSHSPCIAFSSPPVVCDCWPTWSERINMYTYAHTAAWRQDDAATTSSSGAVTASASVAGKRHAPEPVDVDAMDAEDGEESDAEGAQAGQEEAQASSSSSGGSAHKRRRLDSSPTTVPVSVPAGYRTPSRHPASGAAGTREPPPVRRGRGLASVAAAPSPVSAVAANLATTRIHNNSDSSSSGFRHVDGAAIGDNDDKDVVQLAETRRRLVFDAGNAEMEQEDDDNVVPVLPRGPRRRVLAMPADEVAEEHSIAQAPGPAVSRRSAAATAAVQRSPSTTASATAVSLEGSPASSSTVGLITPPVHNVGGVRGRSGLLQRQAGTPTLPAAASSSATASPSSPATVMDSPLAVKPGGGAASPSAASAVSAAAAAAAGRARRPLPQLRF